MLLLKLTDHMFPVKLVIDSQVSSFSRGKSRHPMRNSGPFFVIRLSFTSRTKNSVCLLFDFSKGFLQARRGLRLLNHRFPTRIRGRLGFFPASPPPTLPFPCWTLAQHRKNTTSSHKQLLSFKKTNKLTNMPQRKKNGVGTHLLRDTWGLFGKES
jgi:hypothetical protein